jgi:small subunit ribosomal protein S20
MANHPSAQKRARQALKRRARARLLRGKMRAGVKKVQELLDEGKVEEAVKEARLTESFIAKAASRGVIHKRSASRMISRLTARLSKTAGSASPQA